MGSDKIICKKCGIPKPAEGFYVSKDSLTGRGSYCKECETVRSKERRREVRKKPGFIYIIRNDAFPDYMKIGQTVNVDNRLVNFQTSDPNRGYYVVHSRKFDDVGAAERLIAESFPHYYEWYKIDMDMDEADMIDFINNITL